MWPWGHAALAYLLYSPLVRLLGGRTPAGSEVGLLGVAALGPDLVDKPLSWVFGVFPQGYSVAHSVFVAVPLGLGVCAVAVARDRPGLGLAVLVGYWSHLAADVGLALVLGEPAAFERVLWPVVTLPPYATEFEPGGRIAHYFAAWLEQMREGRGTAALVTYLAPLVAAVVLWALDGLPGLPVGRSGSAAER